MDGSQVEIGHLLEKMPCGWGRGYGDTAGLLEACGVAICTEKCVDCGRGVEVGDAFFFQEAPD